MSSTDPMRGDSSILSETMRRISLRPYRFRQLLNTKSSSLTKQITQPLMYNLPYGRLLRSLLATVDSSSPATTKTRSLLPSTPDVQSSTLPLREKKDRNLQVSSSKDSNKSWIKNLLDMTQKSLQNLSTNTFQIGEEYSTKFKGIRSGAKSTQESSQVFRM